MSKKVSILKSLSFSELPISPLIFARDIFKLLFFSKIHNTLRIEVMKYIDYSPVPDKLKEKYKTKRRDQQE
jgi:hypothetical protein